MNRSLSRTSTLRVLVATTSLLLAPAAGASAAVVPSAVGPATPVLAAPRATGPVDTLVAAARSQIGVTTIYDPAYVRLAYPGGDVPIDRGVCTDVLIRAFRAISIDLQVQVHEDMRRNLARYPRTGRSTPDRNIDHRRVRNLSVFFARRGAAVPVTARAADYAAGDIVMWDLGGLAHTGLVADALVPGTDRRMIVHNIGSGTQLEDILFAFPITGHFRYPPVTAT